MLLLNIIYPNILGKAEGFNRGLQIKITLSKQNILSYATISAEIVQHNMLPERVYRQVKLLLY